METPETQEIIRFRKEKPKFTSNIEHRFYKIKEKAELENNLFATMREIYTFYNFLGEFGLYSGTPYDDLDICSLKGCEAEIIISPDLIYFDCAWPKEERYQIIYEIYVDAWYGVGKIFNEQIEPDYPSCSLNKYYWEPPTKVMEQLTKYVAEFDLNIGGKISNSWIRLLYPDIHSQFRDMISAFRHINSRLGKPFELIVEE